MNRIVSDYSSLFGLITLLMANRIIWFSFKYSLHKLPNYLQVNLLLPTFKKYLRKLFACIVDGSY